MRSLTILALLLALYTADAVVVTKFYSDADCKGTVVMTSGREENLCVREPFGHLDSFFNDEKRTFFSYQCSGDSFDITQCNDDPLCAPSNCTHVNQTAGVCYPGPDNKYYYTRTCETSLPEMPMDTLVKNRWMQKPFNYQDDCSDLSKSLPNYGVDGVALDTCIWGPLHENFFGDTVYMKLNCATFVTRKVCGNDNTCSNCVDAEDNESQCTISYESTVRISYGYKQSCNVPQSSSNYVTLSALVVLVSVVALLL